MNKKLILGTILAGAVLLTGCTTDQYGRTQSAGCDTGTNYGGAAVGAVGGALAGSLVGGGSGNTIATVAGAGLGGYAGSRSRIGCNDRRY